MFGRLSLALFCMSAALVAAGCIVHTAAPVGGGAASISVGSSQSYWVNSYPPQPLYEEMTPSPGYGYVWIDGHWDWDGYDWSWVRGRWVRERPGYVYVAPYYDYVEGRYIYRSGYWSRRSRLPRSVRIRAYRDGRPPTYHRQVRDHRGRRPRPTRRPYRRAPVRDHR